jgi:membrane protease YdiL (CAAX protease family)
VEQSDDPPRWPWGFGFAGLFMAVLVTGFIAAMIGAAVDLDPDEDSPAVTITGTLIQDLTLVTVAVGMAALVARPRGWHFGLRRTALWPAVGWAALGLLAFYVFAGIYGSLVDTDAKQQITEKLGADTGTFGLVLAGCIVMILAPLAEEVFFRGFFYGALRGRFGVLVAAVIDGVVFGLIHWDFKGADSLLILPPLMVLGVIFCLVYERTGSLWPVVAMHTFNNAVAYAVQADGGWQVSVVVGPLMIAAAMLAPRLLPPGPRPLPGPSPRPAVVR